jgi:tRNA U34 2-thiouridine synthase MnmA/TrmU
VKDVRIERVNWVNIIPKVGDDVMVRTRYRQPFIRAKILNINTRSNTAQLELERNTDPVSPGQSLVIYRNGSDKDSTRECLGGGIIMI